MAQSIIWTPKAKQSFFAIFDFCKSGNGYMRFVVFALLIIFQMKLTHAQDKAAENDLLETKFYVLGKVYEYPDSLKIYNSYDSIPKNQNYTFIIRVEGKKYHMEWWSGKTALETPTTINKHLIINRKNNIYIFKIGNNKARYTFIQPFLLIRKPY